MRRRRRPSRQNEKNRQRKSFLCLFHFLRGLRPVPGQAPPGVPAQARVRLFLLLGHLRPAAFHPGRQGCLIFPICFVSGEFARI